MQNFTDATDFVRQKADKLITSLKISSAKYSYILQLNRQ